MLGGDKTDNDINDGNHNIQAGVVCGDVIKGISFEQHVAERDKAVAEKEVALKHAHGLEKQLIQRALNDLKSRYNDMEADYQNRLQELADTKAELVKFQNSFEREKFDAANRALDRGDATLAETLFKELLEKTTARREDAEKDEAALHYRIGKIAEDKIRWHDAYTHYKRAADLHNDIEHLQAYAHMTWRLAKGEEAETIIAKRA